MSTLLRLTGFSVALLTVAAALGCSSPNSGESAAPPAAAITPPADDDAPLPATGSPYDALPEMVRATMDKPFTGDFDAQIKRRSIRAAVTFNRTHYFIDQGQQRGITF